MSALKSFAVQQRPTNHQFSMLEVEALMCAWEHIVSYEGNAKPWDTTREEYGTVHLRLTIIRDSAAWAICAHYAMSGQKQIPEGALPCDKTHVPYHLQLQPTTQPSDVLRHDGEETYSYDWEFVPAWLDYAVDWDRTRATGTLHTWIDYSSQFSVSSADKTMQPS